jgi:predicted AlkP superfamily pyrophosphatase or phosphodiesterase
MRKTVVLNVVGLSRRVIGEHTPFIKSFLESGNHALIEPVLPAVTCSAQSTYLTGKWPSGHGIVGNGWYFKDECEVKFWRQSNKLVQGEKIWEKLKARDENFSCANLFWWYNMYSSADYSVTPRPNYLADGRKIPDIYSYPAELRDRLQEKFGRFPLFNFWGPKASIKSSNWIGEAAMYVDEAHNPTLSLVYLPHLDYALQRHGLDFKKIGSDLKEIDRLVNRLVTYYASQNTQVIVMSEYGITNVSRPVHLNRYLREMGYLQIRKERGLELLDAGASKAFAVADHQVAHVYLNEPGLKPRVKALIETIPGVQTVISTADSRINHPRFGDLLVIADKDSWFTYYYWNDDRDAPDFARMVDIHKKPGYDPVEMFTDPADPFVYPRVIWKLLKKKLGFRTVLDIIPLKAELVKGSHGRIPEEEEDYPLFISNNPESKLPPKIQAIDVFELLQKHVIPEPD